jgi:hypothetical protein
VAADVEAQAAEPVAAVLGAVAPAVLLARLQALPQQLLFRQFPAHKPQHQLAVDAVQAVKVVEVVALLAVAPSAVPAVALRSTRAPRYRSWRSSTCYWLPA